MLLFSPKIFNISVNRRKKNSFLGKLFSWYKANLKSFPIYTKSLTSCSIAMIGEVIASVIKAVGWYLRIFFSYEVDDLCRSD